MKYFTFLVFVIMQFSALSQQTIYTLDLGIKRPNQFYESLSFINTISSTNEFFVALAEENNVHFLLFDKDWKLESEFIENREWVTDQSIYQDYKSYISKSNIFFSREFQPIGSIRVEDKKFVTAFLRNHKLYFQKIDFSSGKSINLSFWEPTNKGKVLHTFAFNNRLYWITHSKKKMISSS